MRMNNFIVISISILVAAYCGAYPNVSLESHHNALRIINGTEAEEGEFPYLVQLFSTGTLICGGAIIGKKWILTAGHCLDPDLDYIVYGQNKLAELASVDTKVKIEKTYLHPRYTMDFIVLYDVAILKLQKAIPFSDKAQPIKLAHSNDVPFHVPGVLAGWGSHENYSDADSLNLQKIELELLNDTECTQAINSYAKSNLFDSVHDLCSDDHLNGQCYGDSGSPFVINGLVYGVVSWSLKPCGRNPGTYSRLTNPEYRSFIKNITGI